MCVLVCELGCGVVSDCDAVEGDENEQPHGDEEQHVDLLKHLSQQRMALAAVLVALNARQVVPARIRDAFDRVCGVGDVCLIRT